MKDNYTLFEFSGHFEGYDEPEDIQYRYVCARNEKEAEELIEEYSQDLVKNGFARFLWNFNPIVDCESVIVR